MDEYRLAREIDALREVHSVRRNPDGTVDLMWVDYPTGWTPATGTLKYDIPADYGSSPPTVHVPAEMAWQGQRDIRRKLPGRHDGYAKWCIYMDGWEPRRHTLVTVTREMMGSLSDPSRRHLFTDTR